MTTNPADQPIASLLRKALSWNYLSILLFGLSGLGAMGWIAYVYQASALGFFNLVNALYIVLSQLVTIGIHNSVLARLAGGGSKESDAGEIVSSAVALVALVSFPLSVTFYFASDGIGSFFNSPDMAFGLKVLCPALFVFSINKVVLFSLNGLGEVRIFALGQSFRYAAIFFSVVTISLCTTEPKWLAISFLIAELSLAVLFIGYFFSRNLIVAPPSFAWVRSHWLYGVKGFGSGFFLTMNINIDVLILGLFVSQRDLGIYGLAAAIVVGLFHIFTAIRVSFNPILANLICGGRLSSVANLISNARKYIILGIIPSSAIVLTVLPFLIAQFLPDKGFEASWYLLLVLIPGVIVYGLFFPFDQMLLMGGYPGQQTVLNLIVLLSNIALNFVLINFYGIWGAAIATSVVTVFIAPISLRILIKKHLDIDIFFPRRQVSIG